MSTKAKSRPRVVVRLPGRSESLTAATEVPTSGVALWEGPVIFEGVPTGDGRLFEKNSIRWEELPISLSWAKQNLPEHMESVVVGRILTLERQGDAIFGTGDIDLASDEGHELARLMVGDENGPVVNGVSGDLDDVDVEIRVAKEVLDEMDAEFDAMFADEVEDDGDDDDEEVDEDGYVTVFEFASDDEMMVFTDARLRGATVVSNPALIDARLKITGFDEPEANPEVEPPENDEESLAAGATPVRPPSAWFRDPKFGSRPEQDPRLVRDDKLGITAAPLTLTEDGQVFGHLAPWKACHTGFSECVNPPRSASGYRYFHTGTIRTKEGDEIAVGRLTLDTLHAGRKLSSTDAAAHYEHSGVAVADVVAGEDEHGIWIAGALRPGLSDETIRELKSSPPSGDWRRIGGTLELIAALAVNSPGFPVPRAMVASASDDVITVQTLQIPGVPIERPDGPLSKDDLDMLRRMAERERAAEMRRAADSLANRMHEMRS